MHLSKPSLRCRFSCHRAFRAFTLIELLVVISIIAILAGIALPVFSIMAQPAKEATCTSNIRQVTMATYLAANDNDGRFPNMHGFSWEPGTYWIADKLNPYLGAMPNTSPTKVIHCPAAQNNPNQTWLQDNQYPGYKYNVFYAQDKRPLISSMKAMVFFDTTWADWTQKVYSHSPGGGAFLNVAYADGHVGQLKYAEYQALNTDSDESKTDFFKLGWVQVNGQ